MFSRRWLLAAGLSPAPALLAGAAEASGQAPESTVAFFTGSGALASAKPPAEVVLVRLDGYTTPGDGGGAAYRRVSAEPMHPGKLRSADGAWWELCEHRPTPEMFGADGTYDNDTRALQACCDYVRANYIYTHLGDHQRLSANNNTTNAVYLNSRTYYINKSIDFTDNGVLPGLSIVGQGGFGSIIAAKLDEAFPVLDMSGVASARVSKIRIQSQLGDQSSCCLLMAQVADCVLHNNNLLVEECELNSDYSANSAGALVVQAGDLLKVRECRFVNSLGPACSVGSGLPALYHGTAVAAGSDRSRIQLNVSGSYNNNPANLNASVIGKYVSLWPVKQWDFTRIRKIVGFNQASNTIYLDKDIDFSPIETTQIAILTISSKYKNLSNGPDNTLSVVESTSFEGAPALVLRTQIAFSASDCYFANIGLGAEAIVRMDDYLFSPYEHVVRFLGGCRWENQSKNLNCNTIEVYNQVILLHIEGDLTNDSRGQAHIVAKNGGYIENIFYNGTSNADVQLLNILNQDGRPGSIKSISGIGKWQRLGVVGEVGHWSLQPILSAGGMLDTLSAVAKSGNYQGTPFLQGPAVRVGLEGYVTQLVELQPFDPVRLRTTGGTSQRRLRWTLPAGALKASGNFRARFHGEFVGSCAAPVRIFGVQLNGAGMGPLESCSLSQGVTWRMVLDIMRPGSGWAWSGSIWNGLTLSNAFQGALPSLDEDSDIYIDVFEQAQTGNATDVTTYFGLLS